jgi:hypothetical protein
MPSIQQSIRLLGGIAARRELLARGHVDAWIRIFCEGGRLERVRNGWYALPGGSGPVKRAWRVGGRLACVSAANHHGLNLPDNGELHVGVSTRSTRLRHPDSKARRLRDSDSPSLVVHWTDDRSMEELCGGERTTVSLAAAIDQIMRCPRAVAAAATLARGGMQMSSDSRNR